MAAPTTKKVIAGRPKVGGGFLRSPIGTALPTSIDVALDAAFIKLGYWSKDGYKITPDRSVSTEQAAGGDTVLSMQDSFGAKMAARLIQALDADAQKVAFGSSNVTVTAATSTTGTQTTAKLTADELDHGSYVFEVKNGIKRQRIVVVDAQVTKLGDLEWTDSKAVGYDIEATLFPDENGVYVYIYSDDGVTTV